jgi:hypothetical protein
MNRSPVSFPLLAVSLVIVSSLGPAVVRADWSENFNGSLTQPWLFGNFSAGGSSSTFTPKVDPLYPDAIVNNQLRLADPNSAAVGGAAAGFGVVLAPFSDLRMTGVMNPGGNAAISPTLTLLARGNLASGQFYAAEVDYASGKLIIFRNDNPATSTDLVDAVIPGLTTDDSLYLTFRLLGSSLSAHVFDAPGGTLLQSVSTTDATYSAGLSGVLVNADDPTVPLLGVWDDVSATSIPEPGTSLLALAALSAALGRKRRG